MGNLFAYIHIRCNTLFFKYLGTGIACLLVKAKLMEVGEMKSTRSNNKGFTLIELLTVISIIGVLAAIAIPTYAQYKTRSHDSAAKSDLHNVYLACKGYWLDNGSGSSCTVSIVNSSAYGYTQTATVNITASGAETAFSSTAFNMASANSFTINSVGNIS